MISYFPKLIILASDGLTDNLFDKDILRTVSHFVGLSSSIQECPLQDLASSLCHQARDVYECGLSVCTPLQQKYIEEGHSWAKQMTRGKLDDVTVVVGVIVWGGIRCGKESAQLIGGSRLGPGGHNRLCEAMLYQFDFHEFFRESYDNLVYS